jgi:putative ABC transport system permease protein
MNVSALDFKLGLRMLRRYPGITTIGTVAMAVAIALGMLYFEGLNKALHPTLPVAEGDRIVTVRHWDTAKRTVENRSLHDFTISRTNVKTIEHFGAALVFNRNLVTEDHRVEPVRGAEVTANAFTLMAITPLVGRTLTARDEQPAEPPTRPLSA